MKNVIDMPTPAVNGHSQTNMVLLPSNTGNVNTFRCFIGTFQTKGINKADFADTRAEWC